MGPSHNFRNANEHVNDVKTVGDIMINRTSKNIQNRKTRSDNISGIREFWAKPVFFFQFHVKFRYTMKLSENDSLLFYRLY